MAAAAVETGNVPSLASVMMDAQQAFNQCAIENCREQLMAPRLREVITLTLISTIIHIYALFVLT